MPIREPIVAGQFYPAAAKACRTEVEACLSAARKTAAGRGAGAGLRLLGGIVPHAGWMCSGAVAAEVFQSLTAESIETYVVFGAVHHLYSPVGAVFVRGAWRTPLGEIAVDEPLAAAVAKAGTIITDDPDAHDGEHSIEVQVPFIQYLAPAAKLLPILVPPTASAHELGRLVAEQVQQIGRRAAFVGSTDLTHYGPRYRFTPKGVGPDALQWAKEVNDRRILDLILHLQAEQVVGEAMSHQNACGGGAVAAAVAACRTLGADRAELLRHTSSYEVLGERLGGSNDAVGYAGVIFGQSR